MSAGPGSSAGGAPEDDARRSQDVDPESGRSDDPRIDPTPDERQTSDGGAGAPKRNAFGIPDPTADGEA